MEAAARAGLGVVGDNGLLIHPLYGSYVFIGELVTDLPLKGVGQEPEGCLHCGRCAAAARGLRPLSRMLIRALPAGKPACPL